MRQWVPTRPTTARTSHSPTSAQPDRRGQARAGRRWHRRSTDDRTHPPISADLPQIRPTGRTCRSGRRDLAWPLASRCRPDRARGSFRDGSDPAPAAHKYAARTEQQSAAQSTGAAQRVGNPGAAGGKLTPQDFTDAAARLGAGIEAALVHAIADVESGGKSGFGADGLPVIAYEGHVFRKYSHRAYDQSHPILSYPYRVKAGPEWQKNNKDQATAWASLKAAAELDHNAALMACSWGMFQVMGFNYEACGYNTVDEFVNAMKAGEKGQLNGFVGFCRSQHGMIAAMMRKDFAAIATAYNGADYGDYDRRIQRAYQKYKG